MKTEKNTRKAAKEQLKIIPIGGLHEIGKNMTVLEYGNDILIIDCGLSFPNDEMYGIDIVIPDFSYLIKNAHKVRGMIITHGHEDHIGAVPYLLQRIKVPIYGTRLPLGLIQNKLDEHGLKGDLRTIKAGDRIKIGPFAVETIRVTHSIADAICLSITTPAGVIFHTGDFKIDYTPVDGEPIDFGRLAEIGRKGVLLMMCESTNAGRPGYTASEKNVGEALQNIFRGSKARIIVATFSSNVHRIQKIIDNAAMFHRKVAVSGRSMVNVISTACELGYITVKEGTIIPIEQMKSYKDEKTVLITTGSQGEPMSALTRMANDNHKSVKLKKNDVVVFSSSPIPGNEKVVSQVVNKLYEKEVEVVLASSMDVHVSGHASQEELKLIHTLIRPKYFMPAHGEYRHLIEHAKLSVSLGQSKSRVFVMSNGDALSINGSKAEVLKKYTSGEDVMVDGYGIGDVGSVVLKDRKTLSQSGLITISVAIDQATGSLMAEPKLSTRGFVYVEENMELINEAISVVYNTIGRSTSKGALDESSLSRAIKSDMKAFIYKETKRNPVIIPVILYV